MASTLAVLTGIPTPSSNLGKPIFEIINGLPKQQQLAVHYQTAKHLIELALTTAALPFTGKSEYLHEFKLISDVMLFEK